MAIETDVLTGLTEDQHNAVACTEGPLLVLAAAGSGKTRVITRRIAHLVGLGVAPWQILALTFTNKAAGEMRERVLSLLMGEDAYRSDDPQSQNRLLRGLTITTFHSLSARLLRRYADRAALPGLKPDYTIYDTADQMALMKRTLTALDLSTSNWPPRSVLGIISNAKNDLKDSERFAADAMDFYSRQVSKIYSAYEASMRKAGAIDFDDLLLLTSRMLERNGEIRSECQSRWRYLLIDEYQDTNLAQFQIARLIAGEGSGTAMEAGRGPNICVVGDTDQAIYGWRGADVSNILEFEEHYPGARTITLGENFRSTGAVLAVADRLIKHNKVRKDKPLYTTSEGGDDIEGVLCRDERHEAELVADWLKTIHEDSEGRTAWRHMAVLYRTNALSRVMEDALRQNAMPYTIARGTAFFQREEVKNALGYLRVVANQDDDVSLDRVINTPSRGIGKTTLLKVRADAASGGVSVFARLRSATADPELTTRAQGAIGKFCEMIDDWTGAGSFMGASVSQTLSELVRRVIDESGLRAHYVKQAATSQAESDAERVDNLDELVSSAKQFEDEFDPAGDPVAFPGEDALEAGGDLETPPLLAMLRAYLESVALVADADATDPDQGSVTLMTMHAAKGLEFPAVAIIGLEEGMLPHSRAFESEADLEEERRLLFVGITRAMRHLKLTSARYRTIRGMHERMIPSRFLDEIGGDHVRASDQSDALAGYVDDEPFESVGSIDQRLQSSGARATGRSRAGGGGVSAASAYPVGTAVRHPSFGEGEVVSADGAGSNARVRIRFRGIGEKTLVLEYARLTRV
ncbi:MAG: UvrD-helicase domain-containing protein [Planctomycetota bacterium]